MPELVRPPGAYNDDQWRIIAAFMARCDRLGLNRTQAAAELGYKVSSLSNLLSGKYGADPSHIIGQMLRVLEAEAAEAAQIPLPAFTQTTFTQAAWPYCDGCRDGRRMGYICGTPGIGKTIALERYALDNEGVHMVIIPPGTTPTHALRLIAQSLGLTASRGRMAIRDAVVEALGGLRRGLLIIDEADRLNIDLADTIRDLWDVTRCGQVWSGTAEHLGKLSLAPDSLAGQIRRRLGDACVVREIDPGDVDRILGQYPDWPAAHRKYALDHCRSNTGRLCHAIRAARTYAAGGVPTLDQLKAAFASL